MRYLPISGPSASSPAASTSQAMPYRIWRRSGAAARNSNVAASPKRLRRGAGRAVAPGAARDSAGIEAGLQLLVAPLPRIPAVALDQLGGAALLHHVTAMQHHRVVRVGDGTQAMAHDDHRAP